MCAISVSLWREHRLEETCEEALTIQTRFSSFEDYWSPFFEGQGPAGTYVAALAPSERDELRLRLRRRLIGEGADRRCWVLVRWPVRGIVPLALLPGWPLFRTPLGGGGCDRFERWRQVGRLRRRGGSAAFILRAVPRPLPSPLPRGHS